VALRINGALIPNIFRVYSRPIDEKRRVHETTANLPSFRSPTARIAPLMGQSGKIAIIGTVGVPARYGGFETLAEELVRAAAKAGKAHRLTVWCSAPQTARPQPATYLGAALRYLPLRANGAQSIPYDALSLLQAARSGHQAALLLGVSGALALPALRALSPMRIVTNIDGLEWQRAKWGGVARRVLQRSEVAAARWSHHLVADNPEIARHIRDRYGRDPVEIPYGFEDTAPQPPIAIADLALPPRYALAMARAEPENNLALILALFASDPSLPPLVVLSNWADTRHGQLLAARYRAHPKLHLCAAEYDAAKLAAIRAGAMCYIHGHAAGGTNPALVTMMGARLPIAAWDCSYNRATTEGQARFFNSAEGLRACLYALDETTFGAAMADKLHAIAARRYRWADVTDTYFRLLGL
jgi:glycosyltransferase involved in cell wall biosynthesis